MNTGFWKNNTLSLLALTVALAVGAYTFANLKPTRKIAFVDSQRLMTGFKESHKVDKELRDEDAKWRTDLKAMEDGIKAFMDSMSANYDKADAKIKKQMQDELSLRNQQANNFERANVRKMQEANQAKMAKVFEKINAFMKEYGVAHHYEIVFGTVNGSILYGEGSPADVTTEVIEQLNARYE
jgi:outer membrane protein